MEAKPDITLFGVNITFMITAILLITVGYMLQMIDIYTGLVITELVIVLGPAVLYVLIKKAGFTEVFRIKKVNPKVIGLCALITLSAYPVGLFLNLIGNLILSLFGELIPMPVPVAEDFGGLAVNLLVIGLTAGLAEELFFRGLVLSGYQVFGKRQAVLITALMFGMFHFNIQNFIGPTFLGIIFGYMAIRTGSIFPPIIGHFINNALSVTIAFIAQLYSGETEQVLEGGLNTQAILTGAVLWGVIALLSAVAMIKLFRKLGNENDASEVNDEEAYRISLREAIPIAVTVLIFAVMAVREFYIIIHGFQ